MSTWLVGAPAALEGADLAAHDRLVVVGASGTARVGVVRPSPWDADGGPPPVRWCAEADHDVFDRTELAVVLRAPERFVRASAHTARTVEAIVSSTEPEG